MATQQWFTERVDHARDVFLAAAEHAAADVEHYPHSLSGPNTEQLETTVALVGSRSADRKVVVVSGTHGIEGHAGAAVQSAFLHGFAGRQLSSGLALVMVHLINPWGCAWNRRENEDNVDIFRNLLYGIPPFAENPLYNEYEEGINPRMWTGLERQRADAIWETFVRTHGEPSVIGTVRRGQHKYPKGMTYHGNGPTWSYRIAEAIGKDFLTGSQHVDVLDIHTGYGEFGRGTFVSTEGPGVHTDQVRRWFGGRILELGHDPLLPLHPRGPYHLWEQVTGPGSVNNLAIEYGTYDVSERFELFRANTHIHTYGDPQSDFGRKTSAEYRELFYPADQTWRQRVLEQGIESMEIMLR